VKYPGRLVRIIVSAGVCFVLGGCFAYEEHETVVPAVETPATTSSTTTTTSTVPNTGAPVERHTTTYSNTSL
jgi:hypothetical protein